MHRAGQVQGWHFDGAPYAVTLMLQPAESGGEFRYSEPLRDERGVDYDAIGEILEGDMRRVSCVDAKAGTLVIFSGHRSLHCVTAPVGERPRVNAILSYASEPGITLDAHTRKLFYGRT